MKTKTYSTLEILNVLAWYKQKSTGANNMFNELPLKTQWYLRENISRLSKIADQFDEDKETEAKKLLDEFSSDEKSRIVTEPDGSKIREVRPEYLEEFNTALELSKVKTQEILNQKHEIEISTVSIDEIVENLKSDTKFTISDLDMLYFMDENF